MAGLRFVVIYMRTVRTLRGLDGTISELTQQGRLEDSGRQNDEKMSRKIGNAQSRATFFRHSAVLSLPAVLLRKLANIPSGDHCAVLGCDNDRRYPEKPMILPHEVTVLSRADVKLIRSVEFDTIIAPRFNRPLVGPN